MKETGFPRADAESDFLRARRQQVLSRLSTWLRREPDDVNIMLPFHEVVEALGYLGESRIGLRVIKLDSIAGTVDRSRDFDRRFRPTSAASASAGKDWPWPPAAARTSRRSRSTGSASCTSSSTATTGSRSPTRRDCPQ